MSSGLRFLLAAFVLFSGFAAAVQAAPAAPTGLRGTVLTSTSLALYWDDNSTNETRFELAYTVNGQSFAPVSLGPSAGASSIGITLDNNNFGIVAGRTYTFKIRAFTDASASAYTNTITITMASFNAPNSPVAVAKADGSVLLTWTDNAYNESGFLIEGRALPNGVFSLFSAVNVNSTGIFLTGLAPGQSYQFQVRGFQGQPTSPTAITPVAGPVTAMVAATLAAPTGLVVNATNETSLNLVWSDNSANNTGYEIGYRLAGVGNYVLFVDVSDGGGFNAPNSVEPGTAYDFQVVAYYQEGSNPRVYSANSNTATVTTPFYSPTNLVVTPSATSPYLCSFSWTDNSNAETDYELEFRKQGAGSFVTRKFVAANVTSITDLPEFEPGTAYEFRIRARYGNLASSYFPAANGVLATTRNGFSSKPFAPIATGSAFTYQLATISQTARTNWSVGALPAGLSFDNASGLISGIPTAPGVYTVPLTANFSGGTSHTLNLVLRVIRPPAPPLVTAVMGTQTITQGGSTTIGLGTKFSDPDTESAMRMVTNKGNLDLILYSNSTPQTVANFLGYVNRGDYNDVLFHRAPPGFVLQGGGYKLYQEPDVFEYITEQGPIQNEPGISNTVGTLAMAKLADDPNSATNEFFYNLADNSTNLDNQNGGFTVFGRVSDLSLYGTLTTLASLPVGDFDVRLRTGGVTPPAANFSFFDLPYSQDGLVKILSVSPLPALSYTIAANTNPAIASASVVGSTLEINGLAPGITNFTVHATDLDGNTAEQVVTVQVQQTYAQWIADYGVAGGQAGATANPDADAFTNLQEFAFFGDPNLPDAATKLPALSRTTIGPSVFAEITFPVRKTAANLVYTVEASSSLQSGSWTPVWSSTEGLAVPAVSSAIDQSDRTIVTVRDSLANPARRFLRVKVQ